MDQTISMAAPHMCPCHFCSFTSLPPRLGGGHMCCASSAEGFAALILVQLPDRPGMDAFGFSTT